MNADTKVCELRQPTRKFGSDGSEDPQTLPQQLPSHSSDECDVRDKLKLKEHHTTPHL